MAQKQLPNTIYCLLKKKGFYDMTYKERQQKHKIFMDKMKNALSTDEKVLLNNILKEEEGEYTNGRYKPFK
ncbi:hypothetical protein BFT35_03950 [Thermoanaerobacterium thermosaccharolyticum]|uniref:Acetyl-coenzyme A carboxylase carboxyl transferase subunit alpha n=3 Tax=Thermoanaerobacterium TaxID=28895 RepID=A0A223I1M2_THETR|nr:MULTISPECIES: hypothetical protein [Thermoanaerobacterium]MDK2828099.1 hypothetical protein [Clostridium butyricum]AEF17813.1 hypothetical protein Thexy_1788 [Thermoanaerobacterium xylanolyticum LX-11]AST58547.1 acetyl-coenzyme A carboxylase carboxyl transferase subunit alpha [Thermoanaerobacterium thermosaccharolyticum]MBP2070698.1 hypothetical protein [Thermoanaerobacterium butyriciformans]PHO07896.1 hypothetical protein BFT35_03950 [Thermoanaerobacterium thermosaccharolyticum]